MCVCVIYGYVWRLRGPGVNVDVLFDLVQFLVEWFDNTRADASCASDSFVEVRWIKASNIPRKAKLRNRRGEAAQRGGATEGLVSIYFCHVD